MRVKPGTTALNAGEFGGVMHARIDYAKYPLGARRLENWLPLIQGGITRRQGFKILSSLANSTYIHSFNSSRDNDYLVVGSSGNFNFVYDEDFVVSNDQLTITGGDFASGTPPTGWTDISTGTATVVGGGTGATFTVAVASTDTAGIEQQITGLTGGTTYSLWVDIADGPVEVIFGTAQEGSDLGGGLLPTGYHNFDVTPSGTSFWITLKSTDKSPRLVTEIGSNATGTLISVTHPYTTAELEAIDYTQSVDVQFLATTTEKFAAISRRGDSAFGWGIEQLRNGPYFDYNLTDVTVYVNGIDGVVNVVSSAPLFDSATDVGKTIAITQPGQTESISITVADTFSNPIEVQGSGTFRTIGVAISGMKNNTIVQLQRSIGVAGNWAFVKAYVEPDGTDLYDDGLDNQVVFYRIGIGPGSLGSASQVDCTITNQGGFVRGEAEIISVANSTTAVGRTLDKFGTALDPTTYWRWNRFGGEYNHPQLCRLHEGRLWLGSNNYADGSVSDDFTNFDSSTVDDDRAISRTTNSPATWFASVGELALGAEHEEYIGASQLNKAYTPSDFRLKEQTQNGSIKTAAVVTDSTIVFVGRDAKRLLEQSIAEAGDVYIINNLMRLNPEIGLGGIKKIQIQRSPEVRIWVLKETGELVVLTYARDEDVVGWSRIVSDGYFEDIAAVEGKDFTRIYAVLRRIGTSSSERFLCIYDNEDWICPSQFNGFDFSLTPVAPDPGTSRIVLSSGTFSKETGHSGTITVASDSDIFVGGDVGKKFFVENGIGTIASVVSGREITVTMSVPVTRLGVFSADEWFYGAAITAISGLSLLDGETVSVFADGIDVGEHTVASGAITLTTAAAWVHVGDAVTAEFEGLKSSQGARAGIGINATTKKISEIGLTLYKTGDVLKVGAYSGQSSDMDELVIDEINAIGEIGGLGAVYTGEVRQPIDAYNEYDPRLFIRAEKAGPATVLSYSPTVRTNER